MKSDRLSVGIVCWELGLEPVQSGVPQIFAGPPVGLIFGISRLKTVFHEYRWQNETLTTDKHSHKIHRDLFFSFKKRSFSFPVTQSAPQL